MNTKNYTKQSFDAERYKLEIKKSPIHGNGLFTRIDLRPGDIVGLAVRMGNGKDIETHITELGLWVNHSELNPNVTLESTFKGTPGWNLVAIKYIERGSELVANYRDAPLFIKRPEDYGGGFKP